MISSIAHQWTNIHIHWGNIHEHHTYLFTSYIISQNRRCRTIYTISFMFDHSPIEIYRQQCVLLAVGTMPGKDIRPRLLQLHLFHQSTGRPASTQCAVGWVDGRREWQHWSKALHFDFALHVPELFDFPVWKVWGWMAGSFFFCRLLLSQNATKIRIIKLILTIHLSIKVRLQVCNLIMQFHQVIPVSGHLDKAPQRRNESVKREIDRVTPTCCQQSTNVNIGVTLQVEWVWIQGTALHQRNR